MKLNDDFEVAPALCTPEGKVTRMVDPVDLKVSAELKKLNLEVEKLELENRQLRRSPIRHPSAFIPILTALIGLSGVVITLWFTIQEKNQAVAEKVVAQDVAEKAHGQVVETKREAASEKQEQASYSTAVADKLRDAKVALPTTVAIRFKGAITREDITALQQDLNLRGSVLALPPQRTTEVEQSGVTYYDSHDGPTAKAVLNEAIAFFNQRGHAIQMRLLPPAQTRDTKPGTIRLDVSF